MRPDWQPLTGVSLHLAQFTALTKKNILVRQVSACIILCMELMTLGWGASDFLMIISARLRETHCSICRKRAWKTNLLLILQAALFILLTWGVDKAMRASNQRRPAFSSVPTATPESVGSIPLCTDDMFMRVDKDCYTLLYAPQVREILQMVPKQGRAWRIELGCTTDD